jgi:glycosyltransferase involved in cell wall biosynthesis
VTSATGDSSCFVATPPDDSNPAPVIAETLSSVLTTSGRFATMTAPSQPVTIELSVVMPCLNEAETLAACITKARRALDAAGIVGEIIVADNGSTDGSQQLAESLGARIVVVTERGYGSALMGGIEAARGTYILMGDADDSYDFGELPKFVAKLREGFELVQGCRLPTGASGAMPSLHRWWGNPMFTWMARHWFKAPIHDVHCGMRGFTKALYLRLGQRCTGMEFASENVIKASIHGARITEVPITLHRDGRTLHPPHLKTFRDGWRHLRFYLMYSPRWLFLLPGVVLLALGLVGYALAMPRVNIRGIGFDVNTLLFASLAILAGYQSMMFAVFTKTFAISEGLLPTDARMERVTARVDLERGLLLGALMMLVGIALLGAVIYKWYGHGFGQLDYPSTLRWAIPGFTLTSLGLETVFGSFFLSILCLRRR